MTDPRPPRIGPTRRALEDRLGRVPGLSIRDSRYGNGRAYFVLEREVAHFHGDQRLDVRLTKERIRELRASRALDPRVVTRGPSAEWVTVPLLSPKDLPLALELVEDAVRQNA